MLKIFFKKFLATRHSWRSDAKEFSNIVRKFGTKSAHLAKFTTGFNELSELYVSMFFRSLALSSIGIFIPVFLLKSGYSIQSIFIFFVFFFLTRGCMDFIAGYSVARFGPKHTIVGSYFSQIIAAMYFLSLPSMSWPLFLPAFFWGTANSLFLVAFNVYFSKIKHAAHGGKELGYVGIMERIGATLGPFVGGLLAFLFNPTYIFVGAIVLLVLGLVPLFKTAEPTRLKQHLHFKEFKIDGLTRDYFAYTALNIENNLCISLWPLYLVLFALGKHVYLELGVLTSVGVLVSILATYYIGRAVDEGRGRLLLRVSAVLNALVYGFRPFVATIPAAYGVGIMNEILTGGYRIPFYKAMYDTADTLPGHRIVYLVSMESAASFGKCLVWIVLYLLAGLLLARQVIVFGFVAAAACSLLILTQKFKTLEYSSSNE